MQHYNYKVMIEIDKIVSHLERNGFRESDALHFQKYIRNNDTPLLNIMVQIIEPKIYISCKFYSYETIQSIIDFDMYRYHDRLLFHIDLNINSCILAVTAKLAKEFYKMVIPNP